MVSNCSSYKRYSCSNIWNKKFNTTFWHSISKSSVRSFLGAYLGGYFYDQFGSFDYAWYLAIVLSFIATALHLPIDEKP